MAQCSHISSSNALSVLISVTSYVWCFDIIFKTPAEHNSRSCNPFFVIASIAVFKKYLEKYFDYLVDFSIKSRSKI
jgi:hypothetical protein